MVNCRKATRRDFVCLALAVIKRRCSQFLCFRQGCFLRAAVEVDLALLKIVAAVLARSLNADGVLTGLDGFAFVVLAVPLERVVAGRTGGGRYGLRYVRAFGEGADLVIAIPLLELGKPAGLIEPERQRAHRIVIRIFNPD